MQYDLSICIPARNEEFLALTVENILKNKRGKTEIIIGLDGKWATPAVPDHPDVQIIHYSEAIGQRAITNQCVKLSRAKYIMKVDAHCTFDEGFDVKMMEEMKDDWTMIPTMYNLHAFDWVCKECNWRGYQGLIPDKCPKCGGKVKKDIIFKRKTNPRSDFFRFDRTLHFQYWRALGNRPGNDGDIAETMSIQGSCFMVTRKKYEELNICDEKHGSWGQQGVEVAMKTWLSGGRLVVNRKTWYAHLFRTQGGTFGFPYPNNSIMQARAYSRDLWLNNKWDKAIHDFDWLIRKFSPIPDWDNPTVGILYYTDNQMDKLMMKKCQNQIKKVIGDKKLVSVSLKKTDFGDNITFGLKRGELTMHKQILAGLKALDTDIVYFCEHDILYHPRHFDFIPPKKDVYYYNSNLWRLRVKDGLAVKYDHKSLSQICADRELLIKEYENRVKQIEIEGFHKNGFEPGTRGIKRGGFSDSKSEHFCSKFPNVDLRHDNNFSRSKWKPEEFKSHRSCRNWQEVKDYKVPGWDNLQKIFTK